MLLGQVVTFHCFVALVMADQSQPSGAPSQSPSVTQSQPVQQQPQQGKQFLMLQQISTMKKFFTCNVIFLLKF